MKHSTVKIHANPGTSNIKSQKNTVLMRYDPTTLRELFACNNFYSILSRSFVFIHNKKDASEHFIDMAKNFLHPYYHFEYFKTHLINQESIIEKIEAKQHTACNSIYVVDLTSSTKDIQATCWRLSSMQGSQTGIWVRGYVSDLSPSLISTFDAMFIFDISHTEYEILRSVIKLPADIVHQMRFETSQYFLSDRVLFFANQSQLPDMPYFSQNPKVLKMPGYQGAGEEGMNIVDFMPVIIEASKFLFNEVSKWIDVVRKKAPSSKQNFDFSIYKKPIQQIETNPTNIAHLVDSSITEELVDEIKSLVEQIRLTRSVLLELEHQEPLAMGEEHAKINVIIKEKSRIILEKVERLNLLLQSVYLEF